MIINKKILGLSIKKGLEEDTTICSLSGNQQSQHWNNNNAKTLKISLIKYGYLKADRATQTIVSAKMLILPHGKAVEGVIIDQCSDNSRIWAMQFSGQFPQ